MNRRQNFNEILNHRTPEENVLDLGSCCVATMESDSMYIMLDFLGYKDYEKEKPKRFGRVKTVDERILKYLDIDTRSVGEILTTYDSQYEWISEREYIDEWGMRRVFTGLYWDSVNQPLNGATYRDLKTYKWPNPESVDYKRVEEIAKKVKDLYENTDYIICGDLPMHGIFELGCWMCGFDDFLIKMVLDTDFVRAFFEIVLEYQKRIIEIYYGAIGKYIHFTCSADDYATQASMFVSKDMFNELVKPYFKERIMYTKKYTNAAVMHHSCGSILPIIDDIIDCGVDIINPIQPGARNMEPKTLKEQYGDSVVYHGGLDTQKVLPFGTKEEIEQEVNMLMDVMTRSGGYIFAAAHNIQEDVPPENVVHMFKSARKFSRK